MDQQDIPTAEETHKAAQILASDTWNPLTNWRKPAAARTLRKRRIAKAAVRKSVTAKRAPLKSPSRSTRVTKAAKTTRSAQASRSGSRTTARSASSASARSTARPVRASAKSRSRTMRTKTAKRAKRSSRR